MTALIVFILTYTLIAGRRLRVLPLGRPAAALMGAAGMVVSGSLSPSQAWAAIDLGTLGLLFAMMVFGGYLARDGAMARLEELALARARSPLALLLGLALLSAALSALLVNDTICVLLTPLVLRLCLDRKLPVLPYLLALSTSANLGSAATLVGNPQNMLVGSLSGLSFGVYLLRVLPAVMLGMAAHLALLWVFFGAQLPRELPLQVQSAGARGRRSTALALTGVMLAFLLGFDMAWSAIAGLAALMLMRREDPAQELARVDWTLLVFFAALFVVVAGVEHTGVLPWVFESLGPALLPDSPAGALTFSGVVVLGSNLVSNVPLVMLVGPYLKAALDTPLAWSLLAFVSTIAGNLTLVGSVANLIVAEAARDHHEIGFWEYLRFGAATTAASLLLGVPTLWLLDPLYRAWGL